MGDHLDVPLEDAALLEEVELISSLMIAASETDGKLAGPEVDRLLGVTGADEGGTAATVARASAEDAPVTAATPGAASEAEERPTS